MSNYYNNYNSFNSRRPSQAVDLRNQNLIKPKIVFLDVKPSVTGPNIHRRNSNRTILYGLDERALTTAENAKQYTDDVVYETIKPVFFYLKAIGVLPVTRQKPGKAYFKVATPAFMYSVAFFLALSAYVVFVAMNRINVVMNLEGRFEEAVIAYLFLVNILPILIIPLMWGEASKMANVMNDWTDFEVLYYKVSSKTLPIHFKKKALLVAIVVPLLSISSVLVTHVTMVDFKILLVIPYCILDNLTVMLGAYWYLVCAALSQSAYILAEDFQRALRHIGPAAIIAEYRALWLRLSKLTRDTGIATCYTFVFLNLYLFFIITLSIYGLLSQLSEGFGTKDIGLFVTAVFSVGLLFYICDEAHYASFHVRTNFQKKLLMVELSWMNSDAQTEINMFLRATEMNPSNINCGGFFDVNRSLFKSLLTTMVTYLVVLLQFQISIPEDHSISPAVGNMTNFGDMTGDMTGVNYFR